VSLHSETVQPAVSLPLPTGAPDGLFDAKKTASLLGVSESWVRRHRRELPTVGVGRLVRFDPQLLRRQFQGRTEPGNRLKPERTVPMGFKRYQRGSVLRKGSKGKQMWYGMWREDVPNPGGGFIRRQRNVKLGPVSELTNKAMALERLAILMNQWAVGTISDIRFQLSYSSAIQRRWFQNSSATPACRQRFPSNSTSRPKISVPH
jgi:hypothetical protein